jgi:hypothetical protein
LAVLFADEIGPEIRYCAHQLGHQKAYDIDGIVKEVSEKRRDEFFEGCDSILVKLKQESDSGSKEASRKKLGTLMWEGAPVPVRNPELVDVLLKVQEADTRVNSTKAKGWSENSTKRNVAAYDAVLLALSDAEEVARKLVEAQQVRFSHRFYFCLYSYCIHIVGGIDVRILRCRCSRHPLCPCIHSLPASRSSNRTRPSSDNCPRIIASTSSLCIRKSI